MQYYRFIFAACSIALLGCSNSPGPFRQVQFCLVSSHEITLFIRIMDVLSEKHGMNFVDRSVDSEAELRSFNDLPFAIPRPVVNVSAVSGSDFSFGATNIGLPTRQVLVGFSGDNREIAQRFANEVVNTLSTKWPHYEVPNGRGALPMPNCA